MNRCSPTVVNLSMKQFETMATNTATQPLNLWLRHVDNTFDIQRAEHKNQFLQHIKSIHPDIQFTHESPSTDISIPFLYTLVSLEPDNTILTSVYKKPTYTDQYLHWNSHHNSSANYGRFKTLKQRARTFCVNTQLLQKRIT